MDLTFFHILQRLLVIISFALALGGGLYFAHKHAGKNKGGHEWLLLFYLGNVWHWFKRSLRAPLVLLCWGIIILGLIVWLAL
jgi:hypothetical protein